MRIDVNTFYFCRPLYIYMPRSVFDALEAAYLDGRCFAEVAEADYCSMKRNAPVDVWPE